MTREPRLVTHPLIHKAILLYQFLIPIRLETMNSIREVEKVQSPWLLKVAPEQKLLGGSIGIPKWVQSHAFCSRE
jgi:hypothetical protein